MIEIELVVRYAETDRMGIVHHSNYFVWFEAARTELIKKVGICYSQIENELGVYLPLISCSCDFKRACFYEDKITVSAKVNNLTPTRIKFYYQVKKDGVLCATGFTEHAFVDKNFKPINLQKKNRDLFLNFEKLWVEDKL
ncbi:thioesterase superfamily protein [Caldicellulosiruptor kronotskyensis 2002]|uniref:Thioesterase superfamily protein n=1 Tax=Caldicellulosiruptor kronotskyensis (strain DSM 18902 / VKM B-2412 / 2002) TaxID=632348 RepID=E4SC55_CALK2|nr:thioesterase family protein [Caldicellulosiruptor kronotskyensis]ADQ46290.1 thioesterase superfamily protein [Caldicellulosiruptor kronotskyensis 2002]